MNSSSLVRHKHRENRMLILTHCITVNLNDFDTEHDKIKLGPEDAPYVKLALIGKHLDDL